MTERQTIIPREMQYIVDRARYAPGRRVGGLLFVSGQVGRDDKGQVVADAEAQMVQAFENCRKVLTAAGLGFEHVVDMTTYHVGLQSQRLMFMAVKNRYIADTLPCWTAIGIHELSQPGMIIEIKLIAAYPG
jgi:enamine deaminase RidA (YjgF/YER057c/UK114 family)